MQFIKTGRPHSGFFYSYWVKDVPGRSGILFHAGNYAGDRAKGFRSHSWGCVLLGERVGVLNGQRAILASRQAIARFHAAMQRQNNELVILE